MVFEGITNGDDEAYKLEVYENLGGNVVMRMIEDDKENVTTVSYEFYEREDLDWLIQKLIDMRDATKAPEK